jgi:hypothetical protein
LDIHLPGFGLLIFGRFSVAQFCVLPDFWNLPNECEVSPLASAAAHGELKKKQVGNVCLAKARDAEVRKSAHATANRHFHSPGLTEEREQTLLFRNCLPF